MKNATNERLVKVETDITYIKEAVSRIDLKLDAMLNNADKKYATKEELNDIKSNVQNNTKKIVDLSLKIGNMAIIVGLLTKVIGWW